MTHNKNRNPLLNLLINFISVRSELQILSIKDECTFRFSNFLIMGLCSSFVILLVWHNFTFNTTTRRLLIKKLINH